MPCVWQWKSASTLFFSDLMSTWTFWDFWLPGGFKVWQSSLYHRLIWMKSSLKPLNKCVLLNWAHDMWNEPWVLADTLQKHHLNRLQESNLTQIWSLNNWLYSRFFNALKWISTFESVLEQALLVYLILLFSSLKIKSIF